MQLAASSLHLYEFAIYCRSEPYTPVIENDFGQERFLIEDPLISLRSGNFAKVPVIIGIVENELLAAVPRKIDVNSSNIIRNSSSIQSHVTAIVENAAYLKQINQNFSGIAPYCFTYDPDTPQAEIASREIRKTLPDVLANNSATIVGLGQLFSDSSIGWPTQRAVQLLSHHVPVYYYEVTYIGRTTYTSYDSGRY